MPPTAAHVQHRPPTFRRAAATRVQAPLLARGSLLEHERIVVRQLDTGLNVPDRPDPDLPVQRLGGAVGIAGMVDETRVVAADGGVDVAISREVEEKSVRSLRGVPAIALAGGGRRNDLPQVGDQEPAGANAPRREDARAVDLRTPCGEGWPGRATGHRLSMGGQVCRGGPCPRPGDLSARLLTLT